MPTVHGKVTLAGDKGFDTQDCAAERREINVTPHVAQNSSGRRSARRIVSVST
jgi:hypothetical protein